MAGIRILRAGFQTTVQDLGRPGYAHLGVSASGAADAVSLRLGNLLVGNLESAPAIEMTLVGGAFEFEGEMVAAITGADFSPTLDGSVVPLYASFFVRPGQLLSCYATRSGARCYLCISGGIQIGEVLGSASTHLLTGLGGHGGRALMKGDHLESGESDRQSFRLRRVPVRVLKAFERDMIRVTAGPQAGMFSGRALETFATSPWAVAEESNRMGIRLHGPALEGRGSGDMVTEGVSLGAVQVPPGGQPIILFVEHQTTGGYPKIANVISADMHAVGQLRPRDEVRFEWVSLQTARRHLLDLEGLISVDSFEELHE